VRWTESLDDHGSPIISHIISITNLADSKTTEFCSPTVFLQLHLYRSDFGSPLYNEDQV